MGYVTLQSRKYTHLPLMLPNNTSIKFHPKKEGVLLVGKLEGKILLVDIMTKKTVKVINSNII